MPLTDQDRLSIAKAKKATIDHWKNGIRLEASAGITLPLLIQDAVRTRWNLADVFRQQGHIMISLTPPIFRLAVNRFYYAMYHAMRALSFFAYGGDDHEDHSILPKNIPNDFPNKSNWENDLKLARLSRNEADYEPYPVGDSHFQSMAASVGSQADTLLPIVKTYLASKGCTL